MKKKKNYRYQFISEGKIDAAITREIPIIISPAIAIIKPRLFIARIIRKKLPEYC